MDTRFEHSRWLIGGYLVLVALVLLLTAPSVSTAAGAPTSDRVSGSMNGELLYVCNQDDATVSVIDLETLRVIRTIDLQALGFSANAKPHHIAVEPSGEYWYVSLIGEGKVVKLTREDEVVGTASFETPGMLSLHRSDDRLYVGRSMTAVNPPRRIGMIQRSSMEIDEIDIFFPRPHAMALSDESGVVYTASLGVNQIAAVDPETERAVLTDVDGPQHALMQFALSPDHQTLAISGEVSDLVHFYDVSADPLRPALIGSVPVASQPFDPIFTADGGTVWLGNKRADRITAIDVATLQVITVLDDERIRQPHGAAVTTDGRFVLISSTNVREEHDMSGGGHAAHAAAPVRGGNGNIVVIDAATREIVEVIEVGNNATGIAVAPR